VEMCKRGLRCFIRSVKGFEKTLGDWDDSSDSTEGHLLLSNAYVPIGFEIGDEIEWRRNTGQSDGVSNHERERSESATSHARSDEGYFERTYHGLGSDEEYSWSVGR
jgi:hypothetical protein